MAPSKTLVSGSLPTPTSPEASRPDSGSTINAPRSCNNARFACVAGCVYIFWCIAGANSSGALVANATAVSILSAVPCSSLAIVLAVAGTITRISASCARAICVSAARPEGSHKSLYTGRWLIVENVSGRTNSSACSDIITSTNAPACCRRLTSSTALYDAIPPQIPTRIRLLSNTVYLLVLSGEHDQTRPYGPALAGQGYNSTE